MKFPSKVTPFNDSIIAKFPLILSIIEKSDVTPNELFIKVNHQVSDIREFSDILDCLFILKKIEMKGDVIHYVD